MYISQKSLEYDIAEIAEHGQELEKRVNVVEVQIDGIKKIGRANSSHALGFDDDSKREEIVHHTDDLLLEELQKKIQDLQEQIDALDQ